MAGKQLAEDYGIGPDALPSFQNPKRYMAVSRGYRMMPSTSLVYYEVEEKKEKVFIYRDPLTGEPVSCYQQDIKDVIDDLADRGFIKVAERRGEASACV